MNHDTYCRACGDQGVVRTDYADDDGQEHAYCTCVLGQEMAEQYNDDVFAVEERRKAS